MTGNFLMCSLAELSLHKPFFDRFVVDYWGAILELGEATNWKYAKPTVKNR